MKYNAINLSGLPISGKSTLAKKLSEIYGWEIYSVGKIWRKKYEKDHPNKDITFEEWWKATTVKDNIDADNQAREIMKKGNVVGDFRFSIICKDLPVLLVFVTADLDTRAKRATETEKYENKTIEEIKKLLLIRENNEVKMAKEIYGEDYDYRNPKQYHVILDSGKMTVEEEIEKVRLMMK
jgi:cytidylate kinase